MASQTTIECIIFLMIQGSFLILGREKRILSISIAEGLRAYIPPKDEDFEMLEKTSEKPKTNMKGEVRKFQKKIEN